MSTQPAAVSGSTTDAKIGERVHQLIWRQRRTQSAVAIAIGVTGSVLSKKLRGDSAWSATQVQAAAAALGVSVGSLYGEVTVPPTDPSGPGGQWAPLDSNPQPTDYEIAGWGDLVHVAFGKADRELLPTG